MKKKSTFFDHELIPIHVVLNEKEKRLLLEQYKIAIKDLPKISKNDPGIANLNAKQGDVIKIIRKSPTAGETFFYRGVINV